MPVSDNIFIFDSEDQMSEYMTRKWEEISEGAIERKGYFAAGLSGGKTPVHFYQRLIGMGDPFGREHISSLWMKGSCRLTTRIAITGC
jgi:6-phosphogluconolactonase/glucosamine-6-phosphate isomerase/deaminase